MSNVTEEQLNKMGLYLNPVTGMYEKKRIIIDNPIPKRIAVDNPTEKDFVEVEICLRGTPMPKQSVRQGKSKTGQTVFYQPVEMKKRVEDYQKQIRTVIPGPYPIFKKQVHITQMHFIYPPLKGFNKATMERIKEGEIVYKNTKPDVCDNLKKLVLDSLSGLVYSDDSIIVSEDDVKKYYGTGGWIIIKLKGI